MQVALIGLGAILIWELFVANGFNIVEHFFGSNGFIDQIIHKEKRQGEWAIILNLLGLLLGFSILTGIFISNSNSILSDLFSFSKQKNLANASKP